MDIYVLRDLFQRGAVKWSVHCLERMQERDITRDNVCKCITEGEIIEDYPDDYPFPSCLVLGYTENGKALHTVIGTDGSTAYIITAYYPNPDKFEADMKTRKEN